LAAVTCAVLGAVVICCWISGSRVRIVEIGPIIASNAGGKKSDSAKSRSNRDRPPPLLKRHGRNDLFAFDHSISIEITVLTDAIDALQREPRKNVPAEIKFVGERTAVASLRLKGHGSFRPITDK